MSGPELARHLGELAQQYRSDAMELNASGKIGAWWVVSGYADVLTRAADSIQKHHRRSMRCYGDQLAEAGSTKPAKAGE